MEENNGSLLPAIQKLLESGDIQGLTSILESPVEDIVSRRQAVVALGKIGGEQSIPPLIRALDSRDRMIPYAALSALGRIGLPAFSHLLNFLKETDDERLVEWMANSALFKIGETAVKTLTEALQTAPEPRMRRNAAIVLGILRKASAVQPLLEALQDEHAEVRARSACALGEIGDPSAVEPLTEKLRDVNDEVRIFSARALGEIGDERASHALIEAMNYNRCPEVRQSAADALGKIGGRAVVRSLTAQLKSGDEILRMSVAYSLGELGGFRSFPPLVKAVFTAGSLARPAVFRSILRMVRRMLGKK